MTKQHALVPYNLGDQNGAHDMRTDLLLEMIALREDTIALHRHLTLEGFLNYLSSAYSSYPISATDAIHFAVHGHAGGSLTTKLTSLQAYPDAILKEMRELSKGRSLIISEEILRGQLRAHLPGADPEQWAGPVRTTDFFFHIIACNIGRSWDYLQYLQRALGAGRVVVTAPKYVHSLEVDRRDRKSPTEKNRIIEYLSYEYLVHIKTPKEEKGKKGQKKQIARNKLKTRELQEEFKKARLVHYDKLDAVSDEDLSAWLKGADVNVPISKEGISWRKQVTANAVQETEPKNTDRNHFLVYYMGWYLEQVDFEYPTARKPDEQAPTPELAELMEIAKADLNPTTSNNVWRSHDIQLPPAADASFSLPPVLTQTQIDAEWERINTIVEWTFTVRKGTGMILQENGDNVQMDAWIHTATATWAKCFLGVPIVFRKNEVGHPPTLGKLVHNYWSENKAEEVKLLDSLDERFFTVARTR